MLTIRGMIRIATMFVILIIGLIAGPAVSLYGSPTVSPVTAAAWAAEHARVDDPDDDREGDRHERGQEHAPDRRAGHDRDRAPVLGPRRPLHDPRVLAELAPHLLHHLAAHAPDGHHRERREEERHQAADEEARDHPRVVQREE